MLPLTLLEVLVRRFPDSSKTTLRRMLQDDRVRVNGKPERDARRLIGADDQVDVAGRTERIDPRVRIVFEDADLIVVDKAEGLLSVPSAQMLYETAETFLTTYHRAPVYHVHRLDRDTSGILVFAKNTFVREQLQKIFAAHEIERVYVAIVHGKLRDSSGTFRSFLAEDAEQRVRTVSDESKGKEAITHYRTTASGRRYSILELRLETGRRNQIRVHLAEAGHPVVGDTMYGKGREDDFGRLALHARSLSFTHPRTGEKVMFTSEIPRAFREAEL